MKLNDYWAISFVPFLNERLHKIGREILNSVCIQFQYVLFLT